MKHIRSHTEMLEAIALLQEEQCEARDKTKLDDLFVLKRWIKRCGAEIVFPYPLALRLSEKPDFVLIGSLTVGVEVTKFLAEERRRAAVLANKAGTDHSPTPFDFDSQKRKNTLISRVIGRPAPGLTGWREIGPTVEMYAEEITKTVERKTLKVIAHASKKCDSHILVIEDHHMNSNLHRHELAQLLADPMDRLLRGPQSFDEVWFTPLIDSDEPLRWQRDIR